MKLINTIGVIALSAFINLSESYDPAKLRLNSSQCENIKRNKPKTVVLNCPLRSTLDHIDGESERARCERAGCCYNQHNGDHICWTNAPTYKLQRQVKPEIMRQKKVEADRQAAILEHQRRQAQLQIIALEEQELKDQESLIQKKEEAAIQKEIQAASNNDDDDDGEHRAFNLIHFGGAMDNNRRTESTSAADIRHQRMVDGEKCQQNIRRSLQLKGAESSCLAKVDFSARITCDVSELRMQDQSMSLCSACMNAGCCYDPIPRIINGRLAPMCFHTRVAAQDLAPSDIEEDLIESLSQGSDQNVQESEVSPTQPTLSKDQEYKKIMGAGGHATAAPDMMGIKHQPTNNDRYSDWIKQNYNVNDQKVEEQPESQPDSNPMAALFASNPRLASKLGAMGISTSGSSSIPKPSTPNSSMGSDRMQAFLSMHGSGNMPSIPGMSSYSSSKPSPSSMGSDGYMNKIRQQFTGSHGGLNSLTMPGMSSSSNMPGMDKIQMLQNMMSGGSSGASASTGNPQLDMIKQMLAKKKESSSSSSSKSIPQAIEVQPEPEPQFNSQLHAQMYKKMMQNFKYNLSKSGKSPMQVAKDMETFKKTVLKRFDKYLIKTTTAAPITTPNPSKEIGSIEDMDNTENKQLGSVNFNDYDPGMGSSNFVPFGYERFEIGNDEPNNCYPEQCGVPDLDSIDYLNTMKKIVGGTTAGSPAFWPWQVSIRRIYANTVNFSHLCGGTLISSKWVLTAAHCFIRYTNLYYQDGIMEDRIDQFMVHVGRYHKDEFRGEDGLQMRTLEKYIAHENFSPTAKNQINDIALGKLLYQVEITEHVRPVCLPSPDAPPREGDRMWITGWGDDMNVADSEVLKELSLPVASVEMCRNDWKSYYNDGWICSDRAYKEDACTGDSGGPAVHKTRDGRWRIVGITAAGSMKCSTTQASVKAGVFTNVSKFRKWIDVNTGAMCDN